MSIVRSCVNRYMIAGTLSKSGTDKYSELPVKKYNDVQIDDVLMGGFSNIK